MSIEQSKEALLEQLEALKKENEQLRKELSTLRDEKYNDQIGRASCRERVCPYV